MAFCFTYTKKKGFNTKFVQAKSSLPVFKSASLIVSIQNLFKQNIHLLAFLSILVAVSIQNLFKQNKRRKRLNTSRISVSIQNLFKQNTLLTAFVNSIEPFQYKICSSKIDMKLNDVYLEYLFQYKICSSKI
ncbi:Uncharacterised protein [Campylobacter geochelonis]|uniref:Transmembrane protein n=1 Tax=Campylobacter geochelonis TaxID=1780362 RepID=A0A128EEV3_9BACT|nr:Uncharacterised protein [Campylobacter geochelonis]